MKAHLLIAVAFLPVAIHAATITVTTTNDSGPGSLRDALASAADGDTIDASSVTGMILLTSGELLVAKSLTIVGPGPGVLGINGNASSRVFYISSNTVASISGLTITNGQDSSGGGIYNVNATLTVSNCVLSGNSATNSGGGIFSLVPFPQINVILPDETRSGNTDRSTASSFVIAISSSTVTIVNCTLSGNSAATNGGAVAVANEGVDLGFARAEIVNSSFSRNSAGVGGAVDNGNANLQIVRSSFVGNSALVGGGIYNFDFVGSTTQQIINSTLSGNTAVYYGGGIFNESIFANTLQILNSTLSDNSAAYGGGIFHVGDSGSATLQIVNSTLSNNSATNGGSIFNFGIGESSQGISETSVVEIVNSTLSGDAATSGDAIFNTTTFLGFGGGSAIVEIGSTILNIGAHGVNIVNTSGTVTSLGYNLSSDDSSGFLTNATDQINTDPRLGPLQNNGGPTFTHALLCGSPAIDQGENFSGSAYDQRGPGFPRTVVDPALPEPPGGDGTDIGAFEVQQGDCNPAEQISDLIAQVQGLGLPSGTANSLVVKLQAAASALTGGNTQAACGSLGAFLNEVSAQSGKKLSAAQADTLITGAARIRAILGC